jgi:hypothetical protein
MHTIRVRVLIIVISLADVLAVIHLNEVALREVIVRVVLVFIVLMLLLI